jgi:D-serine deaminase-like pyridoxal phosphate-dependent protein
MDKSIIGQKKCFIDTPALLIDIEKMEYNIEKMADFFKDKKANLRPHIKTHKCPTLSQKQIEAGAIGITCAKVSEAEVMSRSGINNILIANQIIGDQKINRLVSLAQNTKIIVAVDNYENAKNISDVAIRDRVKIGILVEVNIGNNRCGVFPGEPALVLVKKFEKLKGLEFCGLMGYEGFTVFIKSFKERESEAKKAIKKLVDTKKLIEKNHLKCSIVSCGATGTYNISGTIPGITEIQAGSYATMDGKYSGIEYIGEEFKQALTLLATIISRPTSERAIIDVGMKAITMEFGMPKIKRYSEKAKIYKLAEEHGYIELENISNKSFKIGDKIEIIPSHGCTTINLHEKFYGIRNDIVETIWPIEARGKFY